MPPVISADQRNALHNRMLDQLRGFDDLLNAVDQGDLESAYRLGRRFTDALRLLQEELGWAEQITGDWEVRNISPTDLSQILSRVRDDAAVQHERERAEQEDFRTTWDQAALVRDACEGLLRSLSRGPDAGSGEITAVPPILPRR